MLTLLLAIQTFAQEYVGTTNVLRPVVAGTVQDEQAIDYLTAANAVESGALAHYTAGQSVTLQPGFVAQAGSVFQATIRSVTDRPASEPGTTFAVTAFPNPFETTTTVVYYLPKSRRVTHTLTDATGRLIRRAEGQQSELVGSHRLPLDLSILPAGVYLYRVETGNESKLLRLVKK